MIVERDLNEVWNMIGGYNHLLIKIKTGKWCMKSDEFGAVIHHVDYGLVGEKEEIKVDNKFGVFRFGLEPVSFDLCGLAQKYSMELTRVSGLVECCEILFR